MGSCVLSVVMLRSFAYLLLFVKHPFLTHLFLILLILLKCKIYSIYIVSLSAPALVLVCVY